MPNHDAQTVILSRATILLVTGVGVGLLTLTYVLGVQVGKQSAALRQPQSRTAGEDLTELPVSIDEQLKLLDNREFEKTRKPEAPPAETKPEEAKAEDPKPQEPKVDPKEPEAKKARGQKARREKA